jgi:hypothetical protein
MNRTAASGSSAAVIRTESTLTRSARHHAGAAASLVCIRKGFVTHAGITADVESCRFHRLGLLTILACSVF